MLDTLIKIVSTVAPILGDLLGSPLAGAGIALLGQKLLGNSAASVSDIINSLKESPDQIVKLKEIEADLKKQQMENNLAEDTLDANNQLAQVDLDKTEAQSGNWFQSSWRPLTGWVCCLGWAYSTIGLAVIKSLCALAVLAGTNPQLSQQVISLLPTIDAGPLTTMLLAMLGMAGWRSLDKMNGVTK